MNICQRINHNFALSPSGKAQDFDSCIRWFESNKGSSAYFLLTVYLCNQDGPPFNIYLFGFVQLRVVQDYPRGFASHRGVKFNLSRIFLIPPTIYYKILGSRYRRHMPCVRLVEEAVLKIVWV